MNDTLNPLLLLNELSKELYEVEQKLFDLRNKMLTIQQSIINQGQPEYLVPKLEKEEVLPFPIPF